MNEEQEPTVDKTPIFNEELDQLVEPDEPEESDEHDFFNLLEILESWYQTTEPWIASMTLIPIVSHITDLQWYQMLPKQVRNPCLVVIQEQTQ